MLQDITIPNKLLSIINRDIFKVLTKLFGCKTITSHKEIFKILKKNPNYRSQIFDADLLHKSSSHKDSRIILQLRFEEILTKGFRRSVTQKVYADTLIKYWKKTIV